MATEFSRRTFIQGTAAAGAVLFSQSGASAAEAEILESTIIRGSGHYRGWPTLARRTNGELLLVCSGSREHHVCPFGCVELQRSDDEGKTWSYPRVVIDGPIDDRDAGVLETANGSILITTFSSLAYEPILHKAEKSQNWEAERLQKWQAAHNRVSADGRKAALGIWMMRSTDGGVSFSQPYSPLVNSPHGPVQLSDGRVLYAGKELWHGENRVGVSVSEDDGQSWQWLATIPTRTGDSPEKYHELHAVEAANGQLIVQIRNHNANNNRETLQCESDDGGKTWSMPHSIGVWGLPSHLLRLADDRLLMTYGHRRKPLGNQARVSEDHGKTWSEPMIVSGDGTSGDLGYPSTVELSGGKLLSVWYEKMAGSDKSVLRQTSWKIS
jgi:Neuraminidase (sialidase)